MLATAVRLSSDDVSATSRSADDIRCVSAAVAARVVTVQSSAPRQRAAATRDPVVGRRQHLGGGRQRRRRRSTDASHTSPSSHTPRLYHHQVQQTHQPGAGEAPNSLLPFRWYVSYRIYVMSGVTVLVKSSFCGDSTPPLCLILTFRRPLLPYGYNCVAMSLWVHPVLDRVNPSFVIFDIRAL